MPRPISWLPRLHVIRRSVQNSVRSHYDRHELERLFEIQARSAQLLLDMLPTLQLGRSLLVERDALLAFLEKVSKADDASAELAILRTEKQKTPKKVLRYVVTRDVAETTIASLPLNLHVEPGRMEIRFETLEQLAQTLYAIGMALDHDLEACSRAWVPVGSKTQLIV